LILSAGALYQGCNDGTEGVQAAVSCGQSELIAQCPQNTTPNLTAAALSSCEQSGGLETGADPSASGEVSQACFGEGSCRVVCEFNDPCQYGVYTLSDGDGIVCNAPPGGAGDGVCGNGENELNSPRDCGAVCEPGEVLCENGNAQILCAQNERFMDALSCAPDEVCRNGQGCVQETNSEPNDMDMGIPDPEIDAAMPLEDMNTPIENDMAIPVELDMSVPIEDAAPPPVDAAPSPVCQEYPLNGLPRGCNVSSERFAGLMERAFGNMDQAIRVCPALENAREPDEAIEYFVATGSEQVIPALVGNPQFEHLYGREVCPDNQNTDRFLFHFYPYISQIENWEERCFAEFNHAILLGENQDNVPGLCRRWSDQYLACRESDLLRCEQCDEQTGPALTGWCQNSLRRADAELAFQVMSLLTMATIDSAVESRSCRAFVSNSDRVMRDFADGLSCSQP